jgi:catechol 2,3-dioxygenase-like lactoylglutathione lyase family enzyme
MRIPSVVAMVPVTDMVRSLAFYQQLGFDVENDFVPDGQTTPSWAWLDGGGGLLMLHRVEGELPNSDRRAVFYVYCSDVVEAHEMLREKGIAVGPLETRSYAPKGEFRVEDPDGHVLMFTQY